MTSTPLIGEFASLLAAVCWAVAVTLFKRPIKEHGPWTVNFAKSVVGASLLGLTALVLGEATSLLAAPAGAVSLLVLSGILGLTVGDTALFAAVDRLGVHRALLFQTLGPVFATILALGFFGEAFVPGRLLGIAIILCGVALVIAPPRRPKRPATPARSSLVGYLLATLAALGQGSGIVIAKAGMLDAAGNEVMPLVASSFLRLLAATASMALVMAVSGRLRGAMAVLIRPEPLARVVPPSVLGTYLAFLLMMAGIAWAPASVASVLLSTSPVFSLFIDLRVEGTPITLQGLAGTVIAVVGVGVLAAAG